MRDLGSLRRTLGVWLATAGLSLGAARADEPLLEAVVSGARSDAGIVHCAVWPAEFAKDFPRKPAHAIEAIAVLHEQKARAVWPSLPDGTYAMSCYHDENNNKKLDTNWIGIPKEGLGASNDARGHMGPPRFVDAQFKLEGAHLSLPIHLRYL